MSKKHDDKHEAKSHGRTPWLDETTDAPLVHEYANRLTTFLEAIADGKIEKHELKDQEARVVALMKKIEPELGDSVHEEVTRLLCELTAYNIMHTIAEIMEAKPKTKFKG